MPSIIIRRAAFTDIEQVYEIERESIASWSYNQFVSELGNTFSLFYVAEYDSVIAGYIIAWTAADEMQINSIAVKKDLRKQGIGLMLLNEISRGNTLIRPVKVFLEVRSRNTDALRFYINNGFTKIGSRKNYYPDDDAIIMEKKF